MFSPPDPSCAQLSHSLASMIINKNYFCSTKKKINNNESFRAEITETGEEENRPKWFCYYNLFVKPRNTYPNEVIN